jgi:hypothetical protein
MARDTCAWVRFGGGGGARGALRASGARKPSWWCARRGAQRAGDLGLRDCGGPARGRRALYLPATACVSATWQRRRRARQRQASRRHLGPSCARGPPRAQPAHSATDAQAARPCATRLRHVGRSLEAGGALRPSVHHGCKRCASDGCPYAARATRGAAGALSARGCETGGPADAATRAPDGRFKVPCRLGFGFLRCCAAARVYRRALQGAQHAGIVLARRCALCSRNAWRHCAASPVSSWQIHIT